MGRRAIATAVIFVAGCGLFPSLDGLIDGEDASVDSNPNFDSNSNSDSTCSTCNNDGGADASDAKQTFDGAPKDAKSEADAIIPPDGAICGNTTVNNCANCPNAPQTCITCDSQGDKSPPFCVPTGDTCRNEPPSAYSTFTTSCDCSGGVATCPLADQVCVNSAFCHTCGEPTSSGDACRDGGTCDGSTCQ